MRFAEQGATRQSHPNENVLPNILSEKLGAMKFSCFIFLLLVGANSSCVSTSSNNSALARFEFGQPQMGLPFRIVLYARDQAGAEAASAAAFRRISQLNDIMSDYDAESELSKLSHTSGQGRDVPVSDDLWLVL